MFLIILILGLSNIQSILNFERQVILSPEFVSSRTIVKYSDEIYSISRNFYEGKYCLLQHNSKLHNLQIPDDIQTSKNYIMDFAIFNNNIFILDVEKNIYEFSKTGDSYEYIKTYILPDIFTYIYVDSNSIICLNDIIAGSNKKDKSQTYVYKIDKKTGIGNLTYLKNPKGISFSLLKPRKLVGYCDGITIVSDALNYSIVFYDNEYKLIDSIKREPKNWIKASNISLKKNVKQSFNELIESYKKHSLVEKVYFINSQQIFVSWTSPKMNNSESLITFLDLWEKKDKKWILKHKDMTNISNDKNSIFSPNNYKITGSYSVSNNKILSIEPFPFEIKESYLNISVGQLDSLIEEYYYENDLRYSVFVRGFK